LFAGWGSGPGGVLWVVGVPFLFFFFSFFWGLAHLEMLIPQILLDAFDIHQTHPTHVTGILLLLRLVGRSLTGRSEHGKI